jgi:hypothetical protein
MEQRSNVAVLRIATTMPRKEMFVYRHRSKGIKSDDNPTLQPNADVTPFILQNELNSWNLEKKIERRLLFF